MTVLFYIGSSVFAFKTLIFDQQQASFSIVLLGMLLTWSNICVKYILLQYLNVCAYF